jgi:ribosomal protein S18 acetylase RimI-like enzyme
MTWRIDPLPTSGPRFEGAISVYSSAFARPPYNDPDRGDEISARIQETHADRAGFAAYCALDDHDDVLGMVYGYEGESGQWWHDAVVRAVDRPTARTWFSDSYEVVEVAVRPDQQARGIGGALIRRLLAGRPQATSVLSTRRDSRAHILYRRLGFEVINEMRFSPGGAWFYIMGARLPLQEQGMTAAEPVPAERIGLRGTWPAG